MTAAQVITRQVENRPEKNPSWKRILEHTGRPEKNCRAGVWWTTKNYCYKKWALYHYRWNPPVKSQVYIPANFLVRRCGIFFSALEKQNDKNRTIYKGLPPKDLSEVLGKQMCQNVPGTPFEKVPDSNFLNYKNKNGPVKIPEVICHYLNNPKYFWFFSK